MKGHTGELLFALRDYPKAQGAYAVTIERKP